MNHYLKGYTLLEMIVSVGLFSVVMLIATGAYLALIDVDRKARATNELVANLAFGVDSMARSIRTGTLYGCGTTGGGGSGTQNGSPCGSGGTPSSPMFSFYDTNLSSRVTYKLLSTGVIGRCAGNPCSNDSSFVGITDPRIQISTTSPLGLVFYVNGVGTGDARQPQVTFLIKGTMPSDSKGGVTPFTIQTTATQRLLEI
jgi:prepilin-type N-terminal cleavage/methylation domain-containing protein